MQAQEDDLAPSSTPGAPITASDEASTSSHRRFDRIQGYCGQEHGRICKARCRGREFGPLEGQLGRCPCSCGPRLRSEGKWDLCTGFLWGLTGYCHQVTVLTLELDSPTLPPGKKIIINLKDKALVAGLAKNPITIKEGVEYKYVCG